MEQYFKVAGVLDQEMITITSMYLSRMPSYDGEPMWKMMQMLVEGRMTHGKP